MAVEVCHDAWRQVATLYCNTSDTAFGPIFTGPRAGTEAEDFLEWLRDFGAVILQGQMKNSGDAREYSNEQLATLMDIWRRQYEPVVPAPESRDAWREPDGYRLDSGRIIPTDR